MFRVPYLFDARGHAGQLRHSLFQLRLPFVGQPSHRSLEPCNVANVCGGPS